MIVRQLYSTCKFTKILETEIHILIKKLILLYLISEIIRMQKYDKLDKTRKSV